MRTEVYFAINKVWSLAKYDTLGNKYSRWETNTHDVHYDSLNL